MLRIQFNQLRLGPRGKPRHLETCEANDYLLSNPRLHGLEIKANTRKSI